MIPEVERSVPVRFDELVVKLSGCNRFFVLVKVVAVPWASDKILVPKDIPKVLDAVLDKRLEACLFH